MTFTKRRFLSLPKRLQHKNAAELLRNLYERDECLDPYHHLSAWMGLPDIDPTFEALSNRFHHHIKLASISLNEPHFLKQVKRHDTLSITPFGPCAIYLDHLRSGHNVGSILRTVEAFRLGTVHFSQDTPDITNKKVQDASMGTASLVPTARKPIANLPKPLIVLETVEDATPISDFTFPETFTLVIGNEEFGVSENLIEQADHIIEIPLSGSKNSLNVSCAFAIVAAAIALQQTEPIDKIGFNIEN